jgi:hypothetical protein
MTATTGGLAGGREYIANTPYLLTITMPGYIATCQFAPLENNSLIPIEQ